jgi:hypothetical protein
MPDDLTADEIRELLGLTPNATCGFVLPTYHTKQAIAPGGLPARLSLTAGRSARHFISW